MPLAEVGRSVTSLLQHFCDRHFAFQQMHVVHVILQNAVNTSAEILPSGKESRPRWRADCCPGVKVGELDPTRCQVVEHWCFDWPAITAEIL